MNAARKPPNPQESVFLSRVMISLILILFAFGIIMLGSVSGNVSRALNKGDTYALLIKQLKVAAAALVIGGGISFIPCQFWKRMSIWLGATSLLLLAATRIPGIGQEVNGSWRWIPLPGFKLQSSEIAKFAVLCALAFYLDAQRRKLGTLGRGLLLPLLILGPFMALIIIQPDYGTTMLLGAVGLLMLFVAGARLGPLCITATAGMNAFLWLIFQNEERTRRVVAFTDPEKYQSDDSFQLINSLVAFVLGGAKGAGFAEGLQKKSYLPEPHTDFIFATIGEELGLPSTLIVVLLYFLVFLCGLRISLLSQNGFSKLLGVGITLMLTMQAFINMGVVTGILPTKGLALPFISYGGSSLMMSGVMLGVMVAIARESRDAATLTQANPVKDRARWL